MKPSEGHLRCFRDKVSEVRQRWFGHVRRDREYAGRRTLRTELPGRRKTSGVVIVAEEV